MGWKSTVNWEELFYILLCAEQVLKDGLLKQVQLTLQWGRYKGLPQRQPRLSVSQALCQPMSLQHNALQSRKHCQFCRLRKAPTCCTCASPQPIAVFYASVSMTASCNRSPTFCIKHMWHKTVEIGGILDLTFQHRRRETPPHSVPDRAKACFFFLQYRN